MDRVSYRRRLSRTGQAQAWSADLFGILAAADFIPFDDDFSAGLAMSHVGPLGLARLATGRCTITAPPPHRSQLAAALSIIIQARGCGLFSQDGNRVVLGPRRLCAVRPRRCRTRACSSATLKCC
jgi:hypothetical protein